MVRSKYLHSSKGNYFQPIPFDSGRQHEFKFSIEGLVDDKTVSIGDFLYGHTGQCYVVVGLETFGKFMIVARPWFLHRFNKIRARIDQEVDQWFTYRPYREGTNMEPV
jgi:hypothetical protein